MYNETLMGKQALQPLLVLFCTAGRASLSVT